MKTIHITHQPVELYKLLKMESLASSGGEAKQLIADGLVQVNSELELRKRRKMLHGDIIEFDLEQYRVICAPSEASD
ncbi:MAG: RNA-binding S4 domain-containing protein [Gammaproteobacteria bacterium]